MKARLSTLFMILALSTGLLFAQTEQDKKKAALTKKKPMQQQVYYGGNLGLSFGSYTRISIAPLVGYKFTPQLSGGVKIAYEYIKDTRYRNTVEASNYGGSVFARYRIIPQIYAHAEFAYMSYKFQTVGLESDRDWVPFMLLGAGYMQPVGGGAYIIAEVLFDVYQHENSPYKSGEPFWSIGVGVGL